MDRSKELRRITRALVIGMAMIAGLSAPLHTQAETMLSEQEVYEMAVSMEEEYNICAELLVAIAYRESRYRPGAENGSCIGLMQISEKWHKERMERLGITDLHDAYGNMLVAADYLSELFDKYEDVGLVLDMYHGNSKAEYNYDHGIISKYADEILTHSAELEWEHEETWREL